MINESFIRTFKEHQVPRKWLKRAKLALPSEWEGLTPPPVNQRDNSQSCVCEVMYADEGHVLNVAGWNVSRILEDVWGSARFPSIVWADGGGVDADEQIREKTEREQNSQHSQYTQRNQKWENRLLVVFIVPCPELSSPSKCPGRH